MSRFFGHLAARAKSGDSLGAVLLVISQTAWAMLRNSWSFLAELHIDWQPRSASSWRFLL